MEITSLLMLRSSCSSLWFLLDFHFEYSTDKILGFFQTFDNDQTDKVGLIAYQDTHCILQTLVGRLRSNL